MNRRLLFPIGAGAAGLAGTFAKNLTVLVAIGVGVPAAGYHFVHAIIVARAQAMSRIDDHRNAAQASRMVAPDNAQDVVDDLRSNLMVATQIEARNDAEAARKSVVDVTRVLKRAEAQSRLFKERLTIDRNVSEREIGDIERLDGLSTDLRDVQRRLMRIGTRG